MHVLVYRQGQRVRPGVEELVARRLNFAIGRFAPRVAQVEVGLNKVDGDREGRGRRCRIRVALVPRGRVIAEATEHRFVAAISRCVQRIARQIRKRWGRQRRLKRYVLRRRAA